MSTVIGQLWEWNLVFSTILCGSGLAVPKSGLTDEIRLQQEPPNHSILLTAAPAGWTVKVAVIQGAIPSKRDQRFEVVTAYELWRCFAADNMISALCDVDLPGGNGIFLATALSKAKPSLLVVVVSGNRENVDLARRSGFRCLQKPFDLDALKALIENHTQAVPS